MRRRRVTRIVLVVLLFTTAGAIVNVAVAWSTVAWAWKPGNMANLKDASARVSPSQIVDVMLEENAVVTLVFVTRLASRQLLTYEHHPVGDPFSLAPDWVGLHPISPEFELALDLSKSPTQNVENHMLLGSGWPSHALKCQLSRSLIIGDSVRVNEVISGGIPIRKRGTLDYAFKVLPLFPVWPGFAINTIFYAAVLWMLFAMPFAMRRRRRLKRGLCPACAYPVGASPVCTECGKPVSLRRSEGV